jgi:uncharacterized membrane protein YuzA (DUF378 family)
MLNLYIKLEQSNLAQAILGVGIFTSLFFMNVGIGEVMTILLLFWEQA